MTRNGKIARLPREVRELLNHRLADGDSGKVIVEWLNDYPSVLDYMDAYFGGRPITEQNLSEWRQGGYQDWLKEQEARDVARTLCEYGDAVSEESGLVPVSDRLSSIVALALGKMLQKLANGPLETPGQRTEFLELARELALHRRRDHEAARLRIELECEQKKRDDSEKRREAAEESREESRPWLEFIRVASREAAFRAMVQGMPLDAENKLRKMLNLAEREPQKLDPTECEKTNVGPTESGPIQPDPTTSD